MKSSELRLGNLVVYNGSVFTVSGITKNIITADRGRGNVEFEIGDLSPLKVTECWLNGFDFDSSHWATKWILEEMPIPTGIDSVHQLQNLYMDLSGKELQFLNNKT